MNYRKEIENLKEKLYDAHSDSAGNDEQILREMKNEILLKQVLLEFNKRLNHVKVYFSRVK